MFGGCLDIGCGGGANVKKLLAKTPYGKDPMTGIDYSEISVIKSQKINKAEIENRRCEILQGNVMKLPFGNETFDIITAFETIYFWPDINEAFKQVYRVLKGSGTFMICNESNGENSKEEKWTKIIQGMKYLGNSYYPFKGINFCVFSYFFISLVFYCSLSWWLFHIVTPPNFYVYST